MSGSGKKVGKDKFGRGEVFSPFQEMMCGMRGAFHLPERYPDRTADEEYTAPRRQNRGAVKRFAQQNPMTKAAIDYKVQLAVGTKIRIKPSAAASQLGWTEQENREFRRTAKELWKLFMESDQRWSDASGLHTISEQAAQHTRIFETEGEAMAAVYELGETRRSPLSFNIGNINPARVRTPHDIGPEQERRVNEGKLVSRRGYPLGYYLHDAHRNDSRFPGDSGYRFIPTRNRETGREQFIHSYVQMTSDLSRGVSNLASCLTVSCQKDKYIDAALEDAIAKAGLTFILKSNATNIDGLMEVLGGNESKNPAVLDYMNLASKFHEAMGGVPQHKGTKMARLFHGEDLVTQEAQQAGGATFEAFDKVTDTMAAACHGLSLEEYRQRWDETNYSGARSGKLKVWNMVQELRANAPWRFVRKAYALFLEDVILQGRLRLPGIDNPIAAWEFFLDNREAICCVEFNGAPKDEIDRAKTADAYLAEGQLGVATWESYCNEVLGVDWEDRLDQIIEEVKTAHEKIQACTGNVPAWSIEDVVTNRLFAGNAFLARKELRSSGAVPGPQVNEGELA